LKVLPVNHSIFLISQDVSLANIMETVTIHDKKFSQSISAKKIRAVIHQMAVRINNDLVSKDVVFVGILNGSFLFAADLLRLIHLDCRITFIKTSSYSGTDNTGKVSRLIGLNEAIEDKTIVLIEDIVDSGNTLDSLIKDLEKHKPAEIKTATLLFKPDAYEYNRKIDYIGFPIPNAFVIGYGLDYDGFGRNLENIYTEME
jgi:hypoxanthine phosphoribosyltransferase